MYDLYGEWRERGTTDYSRIAIDFSLLVIVHQSPPLSSPEHHFSSFTALYNGGKDRIYLKDGKYLCVTPKISVCDIHSE